MRLGMDGMDEAGAMGEMEEIAAFPSKAACHRPMQAANPAPQASGPRRDQSMGGGTYGGGSSPGRPKMMEDG